MEQQKKKQEEKEERKKQEKKEKRDDKQTIIQVKILASHWINILQVKFQKYCTRCKQQVIASKHDMRACLNFMHEQVKINSTTLDQIVEDCCYLTKP